MRAKQIKPVDLYDLQLWKKTGDKYRHYETVIWAQPYGICKGKKKILDDNKAHFEYYKIVHN